MTIFVLLVSVVVLVCALAESLRNGPQAAVLLRRHIAEQRKLFRAINADNEAKIRQLQRTITHDLAAMRRRVDAGLRATASKDS